MHDRKVWRDEKETCYRDYQSIQCIGLLAVGAVDFGKMRQRFDELWAAGPDDLFDWMESQKPRYDAWKAALDSGDV